MILGDLTIISMDDEYSVYENAYLIIKEGKITEIGAMDDLKGNYRSMKGKLCMPGMFNMHAHLGLWAFRSLADDMPDRLKNFLLPMERKYMDEDMVYTSSRLALYESLASGITSLVDMYYFPQSVSKAAQDLGPRLWIGQTILDDSQIDAASSWKAFTKEIDQDRQYIQKQAKQNYLLAPHAPYSVSKEKLAWVQNYSEKHHLLKMMHVSEMDFEMKAFQASSPVQYLDRIGILDERFLAVHLIHSDEKDQKTLSKRKANVITCPAANMKSGKGIPRLEEMKQEGINLSIGTDGAVSGNSLDLFEKMRITAYAQKTLYQDRTLFSAKEILAMVTRNAAKSLGVWDHLGSIEEGKEADLIFLDTQDLNMQPIFDYYASLVYSAKAENVSDVMVAGEWFYQNKAYAKKAYLDILELTQKQEKTLRKIKNDSKIKTSI